MYVLVPNASISFFEVGLFDGSLSKHSMINPGRISRASLERERSIVIRWSLRRSTSDWSCCPSASLLEWRNGTLGSSCKYRNFFVSTVFLNQLVYLIPPSPIWIHILMKLPPSIWLVIVIQINTWLRVNRASTPKEKMSMVGVHLVVSAWVMTSGGM